MQFPPEKIVHIDLNLIIDPTLLRSLKLINHEDDVTGYMIDGRTIIPLMIKFKNKQQEADVTHHNGQAKL